MERETGIEIDLHRVRRALEVRLHAANALMETGWVLHEIYFGNESDGRPWYVMLCLEEPVCPNCSAPAGIDVLDNGERIRTVCTKECC